MSASGKTEKISVTLPRVLTGEIRSIVSRGQVSSFFADALEHYLAYHKQKSALEKGFGAWKNKNHPDLNTPEQSTAYIRSVRETDKGRLKRLEDINAK